MELATNGSLQRLLRQQRKAHSADDVDSDSDVTSQLRHYNLTSSDLLLFAAHIANGMEYVASQRVSCFRRFLLKMCKNVYDKVREASVNANCNDNKNIWILSTTL